MSSIKELSFDEIALVSGGEGHGTEVNRERQEAKNRLGRNAPTHIYSDPSTIKCANAVFGGLVKGIPGGPGAMAWNVANGAVDGQCLSGSASGNNNGSNSGSNNCSSGGPAGTCNR